MGKNRLAHFGAAPYAGEHHTWNRHKSRQRIRGLLIFLRLSQKTEFNATENGKKKAHDRNRGPGCGYPRMFFLDREAAG